MNFSKICPILKEYIYSPFFCCFLFLLITEFFIWYTPIYEIREEILSKQIWISILFPAILISYLSKIPVKALLKSRKYVKKRLPISQRVLMGGTLGGLLITDVILFWVGLYFILGIGYPDAISNKSQFVTSHIEGIIIGFTIPLMNYFLFIPTRNAIKKQISLGQCYDKTEEFEFAFPIIWMTFISSLIGVVIINK